MAKIKSKKSTHPKKKSKKISKIKRAYLIFGRTTIIFIILIGIVVSYQVIKNNQKNSQISKSFKQDNQTIESILSQRQTNILVGDFNQIELIKSELPQGITILPMQSCAQPIASLSKTNWRQELNNESFAYIFSTQPDNEGFTGCSINQIEKIFGIPNSRVLVSGTTLNPKEVLLFYNRGIQKRVILNKTNIIPVSSLTPIPLNDLKAPACSNYTTMVVVAHQDDDLLFMNPDLVNQIQSGNCVRSVYLTAGDDGSTAFYWLERQDGSEAAYSAMLGIDDNWIEKTIEITPSEFVTLATPVGNTNVTLIFFHLPDGNLAGQGFKATNYQSLHKLYTGTIPNIVSVYKQSTYTSAQLVSAIQSIISFYKPNQIWTQSSYVDASADHSDHGTTGKFTTQALGDYNLQAGQNIVATYYMGYQMNPLPINVTGANEVNKELIFRQYAIHDSSICQSSTNCKYLSTYKSYFGREYTWAY